MDQFKEVKTSGAKREFCTGAKRDAHDGKGRYDLIPTEPLRRLAVHYENGAKVHGDRQWEQGLPISACLDSAERHLEKAKDGLQDEDHLAAVIWNLFAVIATENWVKEGKLTDKLLDMPYHTKHEKQKKAAEEPNIFHFISSANVLADLNRVYGTLENNESVSVNFGPFAVRYSKREDVMFMKLIPGCTSMPDLLFAYNTYVMTPLHHTYDTLILSADNTTKFQLCNIPRIAQLNWFRFHIKCGVEIAKKYNEIYGAL